MWLILSMRKLIKQINLIWSGHDFPFHLGPFNWKRKISVQSINKQKVKGCLSGISISKKTRFKKKKYLKSTIIVIRRFVWVLWEVWILFQSTGFGKATVSVQWSSQASFLKCSRYSGCFLISQDDPIMQVSPSDQAWHSLISIWISWHKSENPSY